jgi:hypothetical protein
MMFHIRKAKEEDVPALARLHVQTFNETHRDGLSGGPSYELRQRQWRETFTVTDGSWFCFVVDDDAGELVGFAKGTPHDGGVPGFAGELHGVGVARRFLVLLFLCVLCVLLWPEFLPQEIAKSAESWNWYRCGRAGTTITADFAGDS